MENIPTDNAGEEVDEMKGKEISQYCLALPMILRKILERLSNFQLVKFSLVNKQWNYEARCLMKKRGNISARIFNVAGKGDERGRKKLVEFASALGKMRVIPFSGIQFIIADRHDCEPNSNASLDPSYQEILDRLPWKHFSVRFCTYSKRCQDCPGIMFVKKVLEDRSQVLEDLSFIFEYGEAVDPFEQVFQPRTFPRLKTLKLKANKTELLTNFAKLLVSCAPNLMELHIEGDLNFNEDVLEGSLAVLVPSSAFGSDMNPLYGQVCDSLVGKLRPKSIEIQPREYEHFDEDEFLDRELPMKVLQAARTTLNSVTLDLLYIYPLMCSGICLENVTELKICSHDSMIKQIPRHLLTLLSRFDFTRCFPKLHQVYVLDGIIGRPFELYLMVEFVEQALAFEEMSLPDRAINIEQLTLGGYISDSVIPFWAQMFPRVKKLSVNMERHSCGAVLARISDRFKCLTEFEFRFSSPQLTSSNLDSAFCGIYPEEVAELREKDEEYLKAVNIVPVMPSIGCMKDLRTLILQFTPETEEDTYTPARIEPILLPTKVTGLIGFERCPGLAVTIKTDSRQLARALGQLKPFASFTSVDDGSQKEEESLSNAFTIYL